jgi:hypothetical protein
MLPDCARLAQGMWQAAGNVLKSPMPDWGNFGMGDNPDTIR